MNPKKRPHTEKVAWFLAAISVVLLVAAVVEYVRTRRFVETAVRVEGKVVGLATDRFRSNSHPSYFPVFVFRDAQQQEHQVHSSNGSYPPTCFVGEKVSVLYDPNSPDRAVLEGFFDLWFPPLVLGGVAVTMMVVSTVLIVMPMRKRRSRHS